MSSPRSEEKRWLGLQPWRAVMILGALVLLAGTVANAAGDPPRWLLITINAIGYVVLAIGFGIAMRARQRTQEDRHRRAEKP